MRPGRALPWWCRYAMQKHGSAKLAALLGVEVDRRGRGAGASAAPRADEAQDAAGAAAGAAGAAAGAAARAPDPGSPGEAPPAGTLPALFCPRQG